MSSALVGNDGSNGTISWHPEPSTRGTWSILSGCVITSSLCVWTAVHLNIPPSDQNHSQFWRKLYWLGVGLFAPEMVAYTAWYQRSAAAKGLKDIQKAVGQKPSMSRMGKCLRWLLRANASEPQVDDNADDKPAGTDAPTPTPASASHIQWNMTHAFYALMGGFALDSTGADKPILPPGKQRMRLTLKGLAVALRVRPDSLHDFPFDAILDKSKASPLAKAIVCGQALWFCLQCLGRLTSSAPISLLELNTFAHCVFALVIYIQWWNKPLDVATPTIIRGDSARELLAWMSMQMPMRELGLSTDKRPEARRIRVVDRDDPYFRSISTVRLASRDGAQRPCGEILGPSRTPSHYIALADCDELLSTGLCFYDEGAAAHFYPSWFTILTPTDIERWKCAANLFKANPPSGIWADYDGLLNADMSVSNWPPLSQRGAALGVSIWILFVCAALVYGGLHALPWNSDFRTRQEKILWRASVGIIIGFGPVVMVAYLAVVVLNRMKKRQRLREKSVLTKTLKNSRRKFVFAVSIGILLGYLALGAVCLGYVLARMFIVVECFIALFSSAPAVFEVPSWSRYIPHIT